MSSLCHDRNSCGDETCNSRSMLVNILFVLSRTIFGNPRCGLKKAIGLTTTLHWHLAFCTFLCRHCTTTTWKCPFVEGENTIRPLSFSFFELRYSLRRTEGEEIIANTLFLSDVFVAVTVIVSWAPSRERGVKSSRRLRNLISQLSFLLVPNMVLAKIKIHEHRTKQTCEIYTFQTLMSYWSQTLWVLAQSRNPLCFLFQYIQPPILLCFLSL